MPPLLMVLLWAPFHRLLLYDYLISIATVILISILKFSEQMDPIYYKLNKLPHEK